MDWRVVRFLTQFQYRQADGLLSMKEKVSLIEDAIEYEKTLEITYLKANDTKSKRLIKPRYVGEMEYNGKRYLGIDAFCLTRQDNRVFRVDRILEIKNSK